MNTFKVRQTGGSNGKMLGRQTMFDRVWLPIIFCLDMSLDAHMTSHTSVSCSENFVFEVELPFLLFLRIPEIHNYEVLHRSLTLFPANLTRSGL